MSWMLFMMGLFFSFPWTNLKHKRRTFICDSGRRASKRTASKDANQTFKFHKQHNRSGVNFSSQNLIVTSPATCLTKGPQKRFKTFQGKLIGTPWCAIRTRRMLRLRNVMSQGAVLFFFLCSSPPLSNELNCNSQKQMSHKGGKLYI